VTAKAYAERLDDYLRDLHDRLHGGCYQTPPVERVWVKKEDKGRRPISKPVYEYKLSQ